MLAVLAAIAADQVLKGWAWRHVGTARINSGGDQFVSRTVSNWFAHPYTGAALDVANFLLILLAFGLLMRSDASRLLRLTGTIMLTGWASNLLDRLGLHFLTAPHSMRGVVDFAPIGRHFYNLADLYIGLGTAGLLATLVALLVRSRQRSAGAGVGSRSGAWIRARSGARAERQARRRPGRTTRRPAGIPRLALRASAGAGLISAAVVGALSYGGLTAPLAAAEHTGVSQDGSSIVYSPPYPSSGPADGRVPAGSGGSTADYGAIYGYPGGSSLP